MFDVGFWELAIIGVIALLVVGPEKLPGLARQAGRWVSRAQRMAGELKAEIEREAEFQELKKLRQEFESSEVKSAATDLKRSLNERIDLGGSGNPPPGADGPPVASPESTSDAPEAVAEKDRDDSAPQPPESPGRDH